MSVRKSITKEEMNRLHALASDHFTYEEHTLMTHSFVELSELRTQLLSAQSANQALREERDAERDEVELKQLALNGQLQECDKLASERDQLRAQNAALMADLVVMRGVLEKCGGAMNKMDLFLEDLRKSNPGWLGKMCLQRIDIMNEAFYESERALPTARKALATESQGAPLIEAMRIACETLKLFRNTTWAKPALEGLEKFLPRN